MNRKEAKAKFNEGVAIHRAFYEGRVWSAGRMVDVGETLGYFETNDEAEKACRDYEAHDFDSEHCYTSVELCDASEFED